MTSVIPPASVSGAGGGAEEGTEGGAGEGTGDWLLVRLEVTEVELVEVEEEGLDLVV